MRGKVGSEIKLEVRREGEPEALNITIIRDVIKITSVKHRTEGDAGYIRIMMLSLRKAKLYRRAAAMNKTRSVIMQRRVTFLMVSQWLF